MVNQENYSKITQQLRSKNAVLVAVSKTKTVQAVKMLYELGQMDFGENYVQELVGKYEELPKDIRWHFIGHLQTNKVKYIAPFVHLIQSVDSVKLLKEINKQGLKNKRIINVLLQVHISNEETKFGWDEKELSDLLSLNQSDLGEMHNIRILGLMGMASFTDHHEQVRNEFRRLKDFYDRYKCLQVPNCSFNTLSMGMSGDYEMAIEEGSTMVRIGSLLFGEREYAK